MGDAADGYPGISGIGAKTAAQLLSRYGQIESFPPDILDKQRKLALLFKNLGEAGIRGLGGSDGSAAAARALRKTEI